MDTCAELRVLPAPWALTVWRCWKCGRVLARLRLVPGCAVEVKCKCGALNTAAIDNGAPAH